MILTSTSDYIEAVMGGAAATTNPDYYTSFVDNTTTTFTPGEKDGTLNGSTDVTICASPAASTQRSVKFFSIYNRDTVPQTITVKYFNGTTERIINKVTLNVGDTLMYRSNTGFSIINSYGAPTASGVIVNAGNFLLPTKDAANVTATRTCATTNSYAMYLGNCSKQTSSITLAYRVTTAAATITWAEAGVFKGNVNLGGNPTLTRLGYIDASSIFNSTGIKSTTVSLSINAMPGDDLWAVFGNQATTALVLRAALADDIQSGTSASIAARPSTVTSPTAWTIDAATDAQIWVAGFIN